MQSALIKLKEAADIQTAIAKQEAIFWQKISGALEDLVSSACDPHMPNSQRAQTKFPETTTQHYLNTQQAAEHLNIAKHTLEVWRIKGSGPTYIKVGRMVRYKIEELDRFTAQNQKPPTCIK